MLDHYDTSKYLYCEIFHVFALALNQHTIFSKLPSFDTFAVSNQNVI